MAKCEWEETAYGATGSTFWSVPSAEALRRLRTETPNGLSAAGAVSRRSVTPPAAGWHLKKTYRRRDLLLSQFSSPIVNARRLPRSSPSSSTDTTDAAIILAIVLANACWASGKRGRREPWRSFSRSSSQAQVLRDGAPHDVP